MKAALILIIEDTPTDAVDWPALGPEIEDAVARQLDLDGDQVGLRLLYVADDQDDDDLDGLTLDDLWDDTPLTVDVPVGAYL